MLLLRLLLPTYYGAEIYLSARMGHKRDDANGVDTFRQIDVCIRVAELIYTTSEKISVATNRNLMSVVGTAYKYTRFGNDRSIRL